MSATQTIVTSHRKTFRRFAMFHIIVSTLAAFSFILIAVMNGGWNETADDASLVALFSIAILIASIGIWHGSRVAALALIVIILAAAWSSKQPSLLQVTLVLTALAFAGIMLWHTHKHHQACHISSAKIGGKAWMRWTTFGLLIPLITLLGAGAVLDKADISTRVQTASEIPNAQWVWMYENDILIDNEKVELFYSEGLLSIAEGGNILTNLYVGSWLQEDGELKSYWQRIGEVCSIDQISAGGPLEDAIYQINGPGEDNWIRVLLSTEGNGHQRFLRRLKVLNERKMHPVVSEACTTGIELDRQKLALANGIKPYFVKADGVTPHQRRWLRNKGFLTRDEEILQFYSYGEYDISPGGALLTDNYFGGWYKSEGTVYSNWAELGNICSLNRVDEDDDGDTPMYLLVYGDSEWLRFKMPKAADQAIVPRVLRMNEAAQTQAAINLCKSNAGPDTDDSA